MRWLARLVGWAILLVLCAFVVGRFFLLEFEEVGHDDMAPTLLAGDQIAVYTRAVPERGDVVICEHPDEPGRRVIGRLVGVSGDRIALSHGTLTINDVAVVSAERSGPSGPILTVQADEHPEHLQVVRETLGSGRSYLTAIDPHHPTELDEVEVRSGYYLLSDNRRFGTDSRTYGEVHPSLCKGVAFLLLLPGPGQGIRAPAERRLTSIE